MERLLSFSAKLERVSSAIGRLSAWAIIALILVIMSDVVLRRWFVIGSTKLQELEWHLHGFLFLMSLGWAYTRNAHVRIELVSERLQARTRAWIELFGCLLFLLPYVGAVLWFGYDYVSYSWAYNEASASPTGLPDRWIIKSAIVVGFGVLGIAALARLAQAIVFLFGRADQSERTPFSHVEPHLGDS
ncbi:TRAP transporter small permease subunit [Kordiimonas lipolytica]|uniref:TRAP transporter small permease protein n=1 Tax=Kordiimonas lipolytica TaxID=1662421 RepID=A0ABV8UG99_9PROT|nr:TRAP transporter small permease subunit [Kordiimonas lipolytica]